MKNTGTIWQTFAKKLKKKSHLKREFFSDFLLFLDPRVLLAITFICLLDQVFMLTYGKLTTSHGLVLETQF